MMSRLKVLGSLVITLVLVVSACATLEETGQVLGGVAGGVAGSQVGGGTGRTIATIGGALLGAAIGGRVGRSMDGRDFEQTGMALENAQIGETSSWVNPHTGNRFVVEPTNTYQTAAGPCRDYRMEVMIDGNPEMLNGTACRQPDGSWAAP